MRSLLVLVLWVIGFLLGGEGVLLERAGDIRGAMLLCGIGSLLILVGWLCTFTAELPFWYWSQSDWDKKFARKRP